MNNNDDGLSAFFPWRKDWWRAYVELPPTLAPTLILVCGIDNCHEIVGEVKTDGDGSIALMYSRLGERTVPAITEASLDFQRTERRLFSEEVFGALQQQRNDTTNRETIRYTTDGRRVTKRRRGPDSPMPLEALDRIICPKHGVVALPDTAVADIREFLATTQHASRRHYLMFRGSPLG